MYVYEAIRRPKENPTIVGPRILREVGYSSLSEEQVIENLKAKISVIPGVWRIYRSVNKRNEVNSKLEFINALTKQLVAPDSVSQKNPESLWKDILMQPHNKAERLFLLDVDTKDEVVLQALTSNEEIKSHRVVSTPNGFHIVCEPFNPNLLDSLGIAYDVSVKRDALLYMQTITVPMMII